MGRCCARLMAADWACRRKAATGEKVVRTAAGVRRIDKRLRERFCPDLRETENARRRALRSHGSRALCGTPTRSRSMPAIECDARRSIGPPHPDSSRTFSEGHPRLGATALLLRLRQQSGAGLEGIF